MLAGRHRQLDRQVAIKQLPRAFAAEEAVRSRFAVEARLTASLDHPHIVPVYDYVEADGLCLLVMELLPGGTVWSRFTADGFTPKQAVGTILACLAGLEAAHTKNYLHRDIKPDNLMFSASGVLKVTDFGIAKMIGGEHTLATQGRRSDRHAGLHRSGAGPGWRAVAGDGRVCRRHHALRVAVRRPAVLR